MKLTSLLSLALLLPLSATAQQRTNTAILRDARTAIVEHLGATQAQLSTMKVVDNIGEIAIVSSDEAGTAFVSRSTGYDRVLGVTPTAYVSSDAMPCGLKMWLEAANKMVLASDPVNAVASEKASDVASFLTTTWNQNEPYNNLCPTDDDNEVCYTGCVATAMAQVMKYFNYPARSTGKVTYYVKSGRTTETKSATLFSFYDWTNMPNVLLSRSSSDREIKAVATLMRDCGYSVGMQYSTDGSAAASFYVAPAMCTNFAYDSTSVNYLSHEYCTDEEWYSTIYEELAAKRPILVGGQSATQGGHAFVFDGMSADGMVHINWGWGGAMDGYYDPAVMAEGYDFILDQCIIYGFNPQKTPTTPTSYPSTRIVIDEPSLTGDNGQLSFAGIVMNADWRDFEGDIIYVVEDTKDTTNTYALYFMQAPEEGEEADVLPSMSGWQFKSSSPLTINDYLTSDDSSTFTFPAGDYLVYMVAGGIHDEYYYYVPTNGGNPWKESFTVASDGSITFTTATAIDNVTVDKAATPATDRVYDLSGRLTSKTAKGIVIVNGKKLLRK